MASDVVDEIAALLRQAEGSKWAYRQIGAFWDGLPDPLRYGERMRIWLPDHDLAHHLLLDTLALGLPEDGRVLDLGGGSGRVARMMLERFPSCHVTLTDASANMLGGAARRLAPYGGRYAVRQSDFFDPSFDLPEVAYDAVVAVLSICHGRSLAQVERLYQKISRWLKPGGRFLCLDHVLGETAELTTLNVAGWYGYLREAMDEQQARQFILETYQEDFPLSLSQHMRLLAGASFSKPDVLYKKHIFALYTAEKAG